MKKLHLINTFKRSAYGLASMLLLAWQLALPAHASATQPNTNKVDICHRTNSVSNPYVAISVDFDAATGALKDNGQGDHTTHTGPVFDTTANYPPPHNGDQWGDIIPPYTWDQGGSYAGLNWNAAGQTVWNNGCKFDEGSIEVNKKVDANGDGIYEGDNTAANQLGFKWGLDGDNPTNNMGTTVSNITIGTHTVDENSVAGYSFTGWYTGTDHTCANPSGTTLPVNVNVIKNQTRHITLCNQQIKEREVDPSSITIVKDSQPNSTQDFSFTTTGSGLSNFSLDDDLGVTGASDTLSNTKTFSELGAGQYSVTENSAGWVLKDINCSEGADVVRDDKTITINLDEGQNVTCTFVNQHRGRVYVTKVTEPSDDSTPFSVTIDGDGNIVNPTTKGIVGGQTVNWEVDQGTYNVNEAPVIGWTMTGNTCVNLKVTADNLNVYCTITNSQKSRISGHKFNDLNGNGQWDEGEPGLEGWTINLYTCRPVEDVSLDSLQTFTSLQQFQQCSESPTASRLTHSDGFYDFGNLLNGSYLVCEVNQPGWTQTFPTDNNGCHQVKINEPGQEVTANFGNKQNPPQGHVLSESTTTTEPELVNTGVNSMPGLFVGLMIIGLLGTVTRVSVGRKYE